MKNTFKLLCLAMGLLMLSLSASAQLNVLISGGFSGPYEQLLPQFERASGIKVITGSGASQGTGPQTIKAQLARGVVADVVIMSREGLSELVAAGKIAPGTDVDLAKTPLGIAVRTGAARPEVSTIDAFKRVVTTAKLVVAPASTSGIFLKDDVLPKLGIAASVNLKLIPRGAAAAAMVASGEAGIAVMPVSEIVNAPGVELVGVIAEEIQLNQIFAAAVVLGAKEVRAAKQLIFFLSSSASASAIKSGGMEPLAPQPLCGSCIIAR
jgi:molybdate transport system substrate-binding protein